MTEPRRQEALLAAELEGRYQLLGVLGHGGMGSVYRARELASGREVALKTLTSPLLSNPIQRTRLQREAELLARVQHPGVVRVLSSWLSTSGPILVMELVEGARPLDVAWSDHDLRGRVGLVRDAARALGAAHRAGLVHRDVKPANLLVGEDGRLRVVDFGLALSEDLDRLTRSGAPAGTPQWMAPEQLMGRRGAVTPATDVWALGVVLYEALTGLLPFPGPGMMELAAQLAAGRVKSLRASAPDVPPSLEGVCLRCLRPSPSDRWADGDQLADALEAWLEGRLERRRSLTPVVVVTGGLALVAATLGAVALRAPAPHTDPDAPAPTSEAPAPRPAVHTPPAPDPPLAPSLDPARVGRGNTALGAIEREESPRERLRMLRAWLEEFPDHPGRPAAQAALRALGLEEPCFRLPLEGGGAKLVFVSASQLVVWHKPITLLQLEAGAEPRVEWTWKGPPSSPGKVSALALPGRGHFYLVDRRGAVHRFELGQDRPVTRASGFEALGQAALSALPDGTELLALADDHRVRVATWGSQGLEPVADHAVGGETSRAVELSSSGRWLVYCHGAGNPLEGSRGIEVRLAGTGEPALRLPSTAAVQGLVRLPREGGFALGDQMGSMSLLVPEGDGWRQELLGVPIVRSVRELETSEDGRLFGIATSGVTGHALLEWERQPGGEKAPIRSAALPGRPQALAVSPDGRWLAISLETPRELWLYEVGPP